MYRAEGIAIDVDKLRNDLKEECLSIDFGGGYGGALCEYADIDRATPEELISMAKRLGISLIKYQV